MVPRQSYEIPRSRSPFTESKKKDAGDGHARGRILVIDDEATMRRVCTFALKTEGIETQAEESPRKAIERLAGGERFDALVLDHAMPELEGIDFLRAAEPGTLPPVVFASAHADGLVAREALALGVWDFLTKPFTPVSLRRTVYRVLERRIAAEKGYKRAIALMHANARRWSQAREALAPAVTRADQLLMGLLFEMDDLKAQSEACYIACNWPRGWTQRGPDAWSMLAQELDV